MTREQAEDLIVAKLDEIRKIAWAYAPDMHGLHMCLMRENESVQVFNSFPDFLPEEEIEAQKLNAYKSANTHGIYRWDRGKEGDDA